MKHAFILVVEANETDRNIVKEAVEIILDQAFEAFTYSRRQQGITLMTVMPGESTLKEVTLRTLDNLRRLKEEE